MKLLYITKRAFGMAGILLLLLAVGCNTSKKAIRANNEIVMVTYNIHHANPPSKPGVIDIDAICEAIRKSGADIVALQEVDVNTNRSGRIDEARLIAQKLGMNYHFFKAIDYDGGDYGLATLSRLPIKNPQTIALPQVEEAEKRILSLLEIQVGDQTICIANTHLDALRSHNNRIAQVKFIVSKTVDINLPIILCGDLNSIPNTEVIRTLDKHFERTCVDDCLPTVPQDKPRAIIDYIATRNLPWVRKSIEVVEETYASDHRPVKVVFIKK